MTTDPEFDDLIRPRAEDDEPRMRLAAQVGPLSHEEGRTIREEALAACPLPVGFRWLDPLRASTMKLEVEGETYYAVTWTRWGAPRALRRILMEHHYRTRG